MCLDILHKLTKEDLKIREGYKVFRCSIAKKYPISPEFQGYGFPDGLPKRRWIESEASCLISIYTESDEASKGYYSGWHVFTEINDATKWRSISMANPLVLHRVLVKNIAAVGYQSTYRVLICTQIYIMEEVTDE